MRLFYYIFILLLLQNCTTVEVTKEIIKNFKEEIGNFMMVKPKDSDFKDLLMILNKAA